MITTLIGKRTRWTITQVASYLGTSRYKADRISKTVTSFPKPTGKRGRATVWSKREVKRWARRYDAKSKLDLGHNTRLGL